jgi:hypothetical protein
LSIGLRATVGARFVLILTVLSTSAARLHAHTVDAVDATQEMNRCLRLVNVAASRRQRLHALRLSHRPQQPRLERRGGAQS